MNPKVYIFDKDIYELGYVAGIFKVAESKTFQRDKLIQNRYELRIKNFDNFFSVDNTKSLFNGQSWRFSQVLIYDEDNELIWDGILEDIIRNHAEKTATIITKSSLLKVMRQRASYTSAAYEDPATAVKNILDGIAFTDYDVASFTESAARLQDAGVYIKCHIDRDDDISIQQTIEKIAEVAVADAYEHLGKIFFNTYKPFTGGTKTVLEVDRTDPTGSEKGPTPPMVSSLLKEIINGYRVAYEGDGGDPATDANSNNLGAHSLAKFGAQDLPEMGGNRKNQIEVRDKAAATQIGEWYIQRSHANLATNQVRPLQKINFRLPISHRGWIDLRTTFRLTFPDETWAEKLFEIFAFDRDYDNRRMNIMAYEVDE